MKAPIMPASTAIHEVRLALSAELVGGLLDTVLHPRSLLAEP